ncbi:MAG: 3-phosphoshikimate 1-carboxyvinyltransferase [Clostridiales bacterium]|jgi:3-phosphoshikimate 1-carboxyvinyltransferase|nr:3-phosphoshikimate 1-carboxyvinyltransferase [Clostridiales bacterium]
MTVEIIPKNYISGSLTVPGDKSISHRAAILAAIAEGITEISGFLPAEDTMSTVNCLRQLGVEAEIGEITRIHGRGLHGLLPPQKPLNCGNSGTTMRLLAGLLAGQVFDSVLIGDESLQKRPMARVIAPLELMGAKIKSKKEKAPMEITGSRLKGINYQMPLHSAQVKSAILLASLYAKGKTTVHDLAPGMTRNHTEELLKHFGHPNPLKAREIRIPGDFSSAAFFIVLGLLLAKDGLTIENVGLNPTRTGLLTALCAMGGNIQISGNSILVRKSDLTATNIDKNLAPLMIDEIPIFTIAAAFATGTTTISGAAELAHKESNRIQAMTSELTKLGVNISATADGMIIHGGAPLKGANLDSHNDHRIAMSLAIAATAADGASTLKNADCIKISYPDFFSVIPRLTRNPQM